MRSRSQFAPSDAVGASSQVVFSGVDDGNSVTVTAWDGTTQLSMTGWTMAAYTGESGILPPSAGKDGWAKWTPDGLSATLSSASSTSAPTEPLNVLTPAAGQTITELDFTETQPGPDSVTYQVLSPGTSLSAVSGSGVLGGTATLTATLTNAAGAPMEGQTVEFEVLEGTTDPTPTPLGSAVTNSSGVATYSGPTLPSSAAPVSSLFPEDVMAVYQGDASDSPTTAYGSLSTPEAAINMINSSNDEASTDLDSSADGYSFTTNFLGVNDVTITQTAATKTTDYTTNVIHDSLASATNNNPSFITSFVGSPVLTSGQYLQGTGDGNRGLAGLPDGQHERCVRDHLPDRHRARQPDRLRRHRRGRDGDRRGVRCPADGPEPVGGPDRRDRLHRRFRRIAPRRRDGRLARVVGEQGHVHVEAGRRHQRRPERADAQVERQRADDQRDGRGRGPLPGAQPGVEPERRRRHGHLRRDRHPVRHPDERRRHPPGRQDGGIRAERRDDADARGVRRDRRERRRDAPRREPRRLPGRPLPRRHHGRLRGRRHRLPHHRLRQHGRHPGRPHRGHQPDQQQRRAGEHRARYEIGRL